ncbi:MAG: o-succinylbenzoate synthase [Rhodothermaceae bacterium]|nr:o-succinylbenzoate synthase [Rhodothermaceae bacterium]
MKISLYQYSLPFRTPLKTANAFFPVREGLLIHCLDQDRISVWAEASPLPGFSSESVSDIIQASEKLIESISKGKNLIDGIPSLSFAVDCILWKIGRTGEMKFSPETTLKTFSPTPRNIPVNTAIGIGDKQMALNKVNHYYNEGYRTFKFKVGLDRALEESILTSVCNKYPDISIRLDANRGWSLETALSILADWKQFNPEYCEEPVQGGIFEELSRIKTTTGVPVAADESVRDIGSARRLTEGKLADFLILKPSLIGNISDFLHICEMAQNSEIQVVVTTALESAIGRSWVYALASMIDNGLAMGLATGDLFEYDIADDSNLFKKGHLCFDSVMLNTIQPDSEKLKNLKSVWEFNI